MIQQDATTAQDGFVTVYRTRTANRRNWIVIENPPTTLIIDPAEAPDVATRILAVKDEIEAERDRELYNAIRNHWPVPINSRGGLPNAVVANAIAAIRAAGFEIVRKGGEQG